MDDPRLEILENLPDDATLPVRWIRQLLAGDLDTGKPAGPDQTVKQFAEEYGLSPATVRRWLGSGKLDGVRLGGRWRIPAGAVAKLTERNGRTRSPIKVVPSRSERLDSWRDLYGEKGGGVAPASPPQKSTHR